MLATTAALVALSLVTPATGRSLARVPSQVVKKTPRDLGVIRRLPEPGELAWLKRAKAYRPWLSGSSIAVSSDDHWLVVADKDNDAVVIMNAKTGVHRHVVTVGKRPERLVVASNGLAYVANRLSRSISVVDIAKGKVIDTLDGGVEPFDVALSGDQRTLIVNASATAQLKIYNTADRSLRSTVQLSTAWPAKVVAHPRKAQVFITHMRSGEVAVVDTRKGRVVASMAIPNTMSGPHRLTRSGFNLDKHKPAQRTPIQAFSATISPDGSRLYVGYLQVNVGEPQRFGGDGYGLGQPAPLLTGVMTFDTETRRPLDNAFGKTDWHNDPRRESELGTAQRNVANLFSPAALVHHPKRAGVFLAASGANQIVLADTSAKHPLDSLLGGARTRALPDGLAFDSKGDTLFVVQSGAFSVGRIDVAGWVAGKAAKADTKKKDRRAGLRASNLPDLGKVAYVNRYGRDPLPTKARRGRELFASANVKVGGGRFTCVSCHPSGRTDGMTWNIGAGPRQTPILTGQLTGTAPFNWTGTEKTLVDNVKHTMTRLGGHGLSKADTAALAHYVEHYLPGMDNPHATTEASLVAAGRQLFESDKVGCSSCHESKSAFTDGELHDISTAGAKELALARARGNKSMPTLKGVAFNTPTLKNLWASAPYYHDGSSPTLAALLTSGNPNNRMGHTSHLTESQIRALTAYLRTL